MADQQYYITWLYIIILSEWGGSNSAHPAIWLFLGVGRIFLSLTMVMVTKHFAAISAMCEGRCQDVFKM